MVNNITIFELNKVSFNYPFEELVLKDISLKIKAGEKICILGANGCGKSTLLKILCGLLYPQEGSFKAFDRLINDKAMQDKQLSKEYHKKVGFIFQNSDIQLFNSTVLDEIAFGPLQLNIPLEEAKARVEDVLNMLNIQHLKNKTTFKLSGGEKKKVGIASVLVMNPEVLILDEPTNGLDPKSQRWLVELLIQLNKAGKTIITSTHNLELVQEISDRAIVFNEEHTIEADDETGKVLKEIELLKRVNLVDEFYHSHGGSGHTHYHMHSF